MRLTRVYLVINETKPNALRVLAQVKTWAQERGVDVVPVTDQVPEDAEGSMVLALGGDGTVLRAAALFEETAIPVLGVNLGSLGFLTQAPIEDLIDALERVVADDYTLEDRMCLGFEAGGRSGTVLNDLVITGATESRFCELMLAWGDGPVASYPGDGLILSTATGSSAYSLSAGGPVIVPPAACILATPLCAHKFGLRPVIFPADEILRVTAQTDLQLIADGDPVGYLVSGAEVVIRRSSRPTHLIRFSESPSFFRVLDQKLNWGDSVHRLRPT